MSKTISRRTVAGGAAWAVPLIAIGAAAPAMAASGGCIPTLEVQPGSFKCCANGNKKGMHLILKVTDANGCGFPADTSFCVTQVILGNGKEPTDHTPYDGLCTTIGGTFTFDIWNQQSCPAWLDVYFQNGSSYARVFSDNVPGAAGNECASLPG